MGTLTIRLPKEDRDRLDALVNQYSHDDDLKYNQAEVIRWLIKRAYKKDVLKKKP